MAMAQNLQEQSSPTFAVDLTDPLKVVTISVDNHVRDNQPKNLTLSIQNFFESLSIPDPRDHRKDGSGWYTGFCHGRRTQDNFKSFEFAVLDADSSIEPDGRVIDGAPAPREVHKLLTSLGLTHQIYTTHSHGSHKGHRYRIVFPCHSESRAELRAAVLYFHEQIVAGGLPLALSRESYTIPNRWHYPRVESNDAPFYSETFFGYELLHEGVRYLAQHYKQTNTFGEELVGTAPPMKEDPLPTNNTTSLLDTFCAAFRIEDILFAHGYTYSGPYLMTDINGREVQALRFKKPDSTNGPGVVVFDAGQKQRLYSHHTNDPLATGQAIDAYEAYMVLNGVEFAQRFDVAVGLLQAYEVERMNKSYPTILVNGSKFRFAHVVLSAAGSMVHRYMAPQDYKMAVTNQTGVYEIKTSEDGTSKISLADRFGWWMNQPERTMFKNLFFKPLPMQECLDSRQDRFHLQTPEGDYFNLFAGWPTKPKQGPWPLMEWHIRNALCGGNDAHYEYLMNWLAHMIQFPASKPNVAVVLRGQKGSGKSIIMSALARSLGTLGMVISHSKHLTGSFNAHLREKVFALVEESFFSGSPSEEGVLKHMISDVETTYEAKGYDAEAGMSFLRVCLVTNSDWAAPASGDERRFFIPSVTDAAIIRNEEEGGTFFSRLSQEIAGGGIASLYHDLMHRRISETDVRKAPDSDELQRQKLLTLSGIGAWMLDVLIVGAVSEQKGAVPIALEHYPRHTSIKVEVVLKSIEPYMKIHDASRSQLIRVREQLSQILHLTTESRGSDLYLVFPPLEAMREDFCKHFKVAPQW